MYICIYVFSCTRRQMVCLRRCFVLERSIDLDSPRSIVCLFSSRLCLFLVSLNAKVLYTGLFLNVVHELLYKSIPIKSISLLRRKLLLRVFYPVKTNQTCNRNKRKPIMFTIILKYFFYINKYNLKQIKHTMCI